MRKPKKKTIIIISSIVVVLLVVGAIRRPFRRRQNKDEDAPIEIVRRGEFIVRIKERGNLEPLISVDVKSNVEGEIEQIFVEDGQLVQKGDPLLTIDDRFVKEEVNQAQANLDAAQARRQQAQRRTLLTEKQQDSLLKQAHETLTAAQAAYEAAQSITEQQISQAETTITTTGDGLRQDNISLSQAQLALQQAQLALAQYKGSAESARINSENAQSDLKRHQDLFDKGYVSKKALEDAQAKAANAQSQYQTALQTVETQQKAVESQAKGVEARETAVESRQTTLKFQRENVESLRQSRAAQEKQTEVELRNVQTRLQQAQESIEAEKEISQYAEESARADLVRAQSALQNARDRLTWTSLTAPMSGVITRLEVEEGEIVTSGRSAFSQGPAIMQVADLSTMVVKVHINEVDISKVAVGQRAEVRVEAYPKKTFDGQVTEIAPSGLPEDGVIKFEVTVEVQSESNELRPAMSANVDIIVDQRDRVLQLPIDTVIRQERLIIKMNTPVSELSSISDGQELEVEMLSGRKFKGKALSIDPKKTRENLSLLLEGTPRGLRNGPTELTLHVGDDRSIPQLEALVESERRYFARVDGKDGADEDKKEEKGQKEPKGAEVPIEVGLRSDTHYEILRGLQEGDRVFIPSIQELAKQGTGS